jgi:predicted DCC family thiol-disulfide oxidoreductase YuxK
VTAGEARDGTAASAPEGPVLLFDGVCGLCNWTVRVVIRLDRRGGIRFAPLGGAFAAGVLEHHPELRDVDSLVLVERPSVGGHAAAADPSRRRVRVHVKSAAVLRLAHHLGGPWRALGILKVVPGRVLDWGYNLVARHRYAVFGRFAERPPPPVDTQARFLD